MRIHRAGRRDLFFLEATIVMKKVNPQITDEGQGKQKQYEILK